MDEGNQGGFQRKMYPVDTTCKDCGVQINEVPFQPDPARIGQIRCRDCHRKQNPMRGRRSFER